MFRSPALAGEFYPENRKKLEELIDGFLTQANPPKIKGNIFGLLLPHASYAYSGSVAAHGFKLIAGKNFDTVIIISDSHYERFDGVSFWPKGDWETSLGKIKTDDGLAQKIISGSKRFFRRDSAHLWEHSIEVQLPFLQKTLKNFKILPIIFGSENKDWELLARIISDNIKSPSTSLRASKKVLVIASADLSHYLPHKEAKMVDEKTLRNVLNLQVDGLDICAIDSAKTLIEISKLLGGEAKLLEYVNSGDTMGGKSKVVGYGAIVFYYA